MNRMYSVALILLFVSVLSGGEPAVSRHMGKIYMNYPEARIPVAAPLLRWDFTEGKNYEYTLHSDSEMSMKTNLSPQTATHEEDAPFRFTADGKITVRSKQNHTADLIFKQIVAKTEDETQSNIRVEQPPTVLQGMKEDGSMEISRASTDMFLQTLFPLPPGPLVPGQSTDIPMVMPFNANGSLLNVKGTNHITVKRYVTIDNRTCAEIVSEFVVADLDVPPELKGKYVASLRGASVFYFDVESRSFHSGRVALLFQTDIESPSPKLEMEGTKDGDFHFPDVTKMSMRSDQYLEIHRENSGQP